MGNDVRKIITLFEKMSRKTKGAYTISPLRL
jgi:hypothetical protein